jgi:hypothetical protein
MILGIVVIGVTYNFLLKLIYNFNIIALYLKVIRFKKNFNSKKDTNKMLKYLYLKNCLICNKKGTIIKNKKNIVVLKTQNNIEIIQYNHDIDRIVSHFNLNLDLININDIVCRKHINQLNRDLMNTNNENININNNDFGARYDENNNIETYEDHDDYSSVESFKFNQRFKFNGR